MAGVSSVAGYEGGFSFGKSVVAAAGTVSDFIGKVLLPWFPRKSETSGPVVNTSTTVSQIDLSQVEVLSQKVDASEKKLGTLQSSYDGAVSEIDTLRKELATLKKSGLSVNSTVGGGTTTVVKQVVTRVETAPADITNAQVEAKLATVQQSLLSKISSLEANTTQLINGANRAISLTNKIDNLSGTRLSNVTFSPGTTITGLTDSSIPDDITASNYMPLSGGTISGTLTADQLVVSTTTATSTFAAGLSVSGRVSLSGLWYPGSDGTNGQVLTTNGAGILSWTAAGAASQSPWVTAIEGGGWALNDAGQITSTNLIATSTTATSTIAYRLGVGTSTPWGNGTFTVGTSSPDFVVDGGSGNVGVGTSSPYARLSVVGDVVADRFISTALSTTTFAWGLNTTALNVTGNATSTFTHGIDIALNGGCFAVNGSCVTGGGQGQSPWLTAIEAGGNDLNDVGHVTATYFTATSSTTSVLPTLETSNLTVGSVFSAGGTGTTTISSTGSLTTQGALVVSTTTATSTIMSALRVRPSGAMADDFVVLQGSGNVGIGISNPAQKLQLNNGSFFVTNTSGTNQAWQMLLDPVDSTALSFGTSPNDGSSFTSRVTFTGSGAVNATSFTAQAGSLSSLAYASTSQLSVHDGLYVGSTLGAATSTIMAGTGNVSYINSQLLVSGSTTLRDFTAVGATTTSLSVSGTASTSNLIVSGSFTLQSALGGSNDGRLLYIGADGSLQQISSAGVVAGRVLKIAGDLTPQWLDEEVSSGGADSNWVFINQSGIRQVTSTDQIILGAAATTTLSAHLEVVGQTYISGRNNQTNDLFVVNRVPNWATTSVFTIDNAGNVGIGSSTPNQALSIGRPGTAGHASVYGGIGVGMATTSTGYVDVTGGYAVNGTVMMSAAGLNLANSSFTNATTSYLSVGTQASTSALVVDGWSTTTNLAVSGSVTFANNSIADAALSTNISKLNGNQAFTGLNTFLNASSTQLSVVDALYIGTNGTSTIKGSSDYLQTSELASALLVYGSTTLQNFTAVNSTTTNSTTTNLYLSDTFIVGGNATTTSSGQFTTNGNVGVGTSSPASQLTVWARSASGGARLLEVVDSASTTKFFVDDNGLASTTNLTISSLNSGVLYAGTDGTISRIANSGTEGYVLKIVSGSPAWALDSGGSGGSDVNWAFFNGSGIQLATTSNQVVIGATVSSSLAALEVHGSTTIFGNLGIGSSTPAAGFTMTDKAFVIEGTTGDAPLSGAGTRMMWVPSQAAFRAGVVAADQWDTANMGSGSAAFGSNNVATGNYSFAAGAANSLNSVAQYSAAFGYNNDIRNQQSFAAGYGNSMTLGGGDQRNIALGDSNVISAGPNAVAIGHANTISGNDNIALGYSNIVGYGSYSYGLALGVSNEIHASYASALGRNLVIGAGGTNAMAIGYGGNTQLSNASANTLVMGMNSDTPTFILTDSGGAGLTGKVGIATSSPWAKLSVFQDAGVVGFAVGSTTGTSFVVADSGYVGVGTTSPTSRFSVSGNGYFDGGLGIGLATSSSGVVDVSGAYYINGSDLRSTNWTGTLSGLTLSSILDGSFSTSSANYYMNASGTVPTTYKANTFTGAQIFDNITRSTTTQATTTNSVYVGSVLTVGGNATTTSDGWINVTSGYKLNNVSIFDLVLLGNNDYSGYNTFTYATTTYASTTELTVTDYADIANLRITGIGLNGAVPFFAINGNGFNVMTANPSAMVLDPVTNILSLPTGLSVGSPATTISSSGNLLVVGSTTLQNFTFGNATGTSATTTNLTVSGTLKNSSLSAGDVVFATTGGVFARNGNFNFDSTLGLFLTPRASTTIASAVNGLYVGTSATSTIVGSVALTGTSDLYSGLLVRGSTTLQSATSTNFHVSSAFSVAGNATSTFTGGIDVLALNVTSNTASSTFTNGIQLLGGCIGLPGGGCLTAGNYQPSGTGNLVQFTTNGSAFNSDTTFAYNSGLLTFTQASTTQLSVYDGMFIGSIAGTATSTILAGLGNVSNINSQLLVSGSTTLRDLTFVNATGTNATTTNLFASNASTTNLTVANSLALVGKGANQVLYTDASGVVQSVAPFGSAGQVLKNVGGAIEWSDDLTSGGAGVGDSKWATTSNNDMLLFTSDVTRMPSVVIGSQTTTSEEVMFEVGGTGARGGRAYIKYSSSTALTVSGNTYLGVVDTSGLLTANSLTVSGSSSFGYATSSATIFGNSLTGNTLTVGGSASTSISALGIITTQGIISRASSTFVGGVNFAWSTTTNASTTRLSAWNFVVGGTSSSTFDSMGSTTLTALNVSTTTATSTFSTGGFAIGGSRFVVQGATGNVGIGTVSPLAQLHLPSKLPSGVLDTATYGSASDGYVSDVVVRGRYAYAVDYNGGNTFSVYDVSDPSAIPAVISSASIGAALGSAVDVQGNYAYVLTASTRSMLIFDISNPTSPRQTSSIQTSGSDSNLDIVVRGKYAYVANSNGFNVAGNVQIFDIGNPAAPKSVGSVSTDREPNRMAVEGGYAYVVNDNGSTLESFDVSNPTNPVLIQRLVSLSNPIGIAVRGKYAYVTNRSTPYMQVFNISNPANMVAMGSVAVGTYPSDVTVEGNSAFVSNYSSNTIQLIDVSNASSPTSLGTVSLGSGVTPSRTYVSGRYLYISGRNASGGGGNGGLKSVDLGGALVQQLEAGNIEVTTVNSRDIVSSGNGTFAGSLNIGSGGIFSAGPLAVYVASSTQANPVSGIFQGIVGVGTTTPYAKLSVEHLSTSGTVIGADSLSGFLGTLLDLKVASSTKFSVNYNGDMLVMGSTTLQSATTTGSLTVVGELYSKNANLPANALTFTLADGSDRVKLASNSSFLNVDPTNEYLGIGTSTPYAKLSVEKLSTTGTVIAADALTGFSGRLLDLKVASTSKFYVDGAGNFYGAHATTSNLYVSGSSTLQAFTYTNATGTNSTTTGSAYVGGAFTVGGYATTSGGNQFLSGELLVLSSTSLKNVTYTNATGTNATTTGSAYVGGAFTVGGYATTSGGNQSLWGELLVLSSTSLRNFTAINSTSSQATTSSLRVENSASVGGSLIVSGTLTAGSLSGNASTATTLATPRAIYGNNFDGSAAITSIIASTYGGTGNGFTKFSGPTTAERTFTLPDASATLLYSGGALGTPSSGVATNLTGTAAGLVAGSVTNGVYTTSNNTLSGNNTFSGLNIFTRSTTTWASTTNLSAWTFKVGGTASSSFDSIGNATTSGSKYVGGTFVVAGNATTTSAGQMTLVGNLGVGTSTPAWKLQVAKAGAPQLVLSDTAAGTNLKHWAITSQAGNLYFSTSTDAYSTSTTPALSILAGGAYNTGRVAIGTSSSASKFTVWGDTTTTGRVMEVTDSASTTLFSIDNSGTTTIASLSMGPMSFEADTGVTSWVDMPVGTSTPTGYTFTLGYVAQTDSVDRLGVYASTTNSTSTTNAKVIIGTTTPALLGVDFGNTSSLIVSNGVLCIDNGNDDCASTGKVIGKGYAVAWVTGYSGDVAETYPVYSSSTDLVAGEIVSTDPDHFGYVMRSSGVASSTVLGIVSTDPGMLLAAKSAGEGSSAPLALSGRVPTIVNLEHGSISVGDYITLSSTPGVGAKATSSGQVVGIALEAFDGHTTNEAGEDVVSANGKIMVFVNLGYQKISSGIANGEVEGGWMVDQTTGVMKMATAASLDLQDNDLINVRKVLSKSGKWSVDENGKLIVEEVEVKGTIRVGSQERRTGITLYDELTGSPFCLTISGGVTKTASGSCATAGGVDGGGATSGGSSGASTPSSVDTEAPVISIIGNNPATLEIGQSYSDLGATVTDNVDQNLGIQVTGAIIDTSVVGTHEVKYNATDNAGNHAVEKVRVVNVVDPNTAVIPAASVGVPVEPDPVAPTEPAPAPAPEAPTEQATSTPEQ